MTWIDTHCHLDAPEFGSDPAALAALRQSARERGVGLCVLPAVELANFSRVRELALQWGDSYALGIHPLYVPQAQLTDLDTLADWLTHCRAEPQLVAVGEIGLDFFVPALCEPALVSRQQAFCRAQMKLAQHAGLPVILHVRRSADALLKMVRELRFEHGGIAHAFNGSAQQAKAFVDRGFKLGFGGALTFERALQLRRLAATLPLEALVLETDAPDIPPQWLYVNAQKRSQGVVQQLNQPAELPGIAAVLAECRNMPLDELMQATTANALAALPKLAFALN